MHTEGGGAQERTCSTAGRFDRNEAIISACENSARFSLKSRGAIAPTAPTVLTPMHGDYSTAPTDHRPKGRTLLYISTSVCTLTYTTVCPQGTGGLVKQYTWDRTRHFALLHGFYSGRRRLDTVPSIGGDCGHCA